jgi:hypothetical protein
MRYFTTHMMLVGVVLVGLSTMTRVVEADTINTSNIRSIASSGPTFPGTVGDHYHSLLGDPVEVGTLLFIGLEDVRGVAEFNLTSQLLSPATTLSFVLIGFGGYFQGGPGNYTINVFAYLGDNSIGLSDYQAPTIALLGSFSTVGMVVGQTFSFDVTAPFNAALLSSGGTGSLGIRLQPATADPGFGGAANRFATFQLTTVPEPSSLALLGTGGLLIIYRKRRFIARCCTGTRLLWITSAPRIEPHTNK